MHKYRRLADFFIVALLFLFQNTSAQNANGEEEKSTRLTPVTRAQQHATSILRPLTNRWRVLDASGVQVPRYSISDPYNQNSLKGDFPVFGLNTFMVLTGLYVPKANFNNQENVDPQFNNDFVTAIEFFHGNTVFKPKDWSVKASGKGFVNRGNQDQEDFSFLELFGEIKLFDVGPNYDFTSVRGGVQFFKSDFNGFIFQDFNLGGQLFGELKANRYRWSLAYLNLLQKENGLLTFDSEEQQVLFANLFVEDLIRPGFNTVFSVHYDRDRQTNRSRIAIPLSGDLDVFYLGLAADGHWGRIEFNPVAYFAFGKDEIGGRDLDISAFLAGVELAYPKDYLNYRGAFFVASGDSDPTDKKGNGFDSINDNINLFGGANSFIIGGKALTRNNSFIPSNQGDISPSAFDNPGMMMGNLGLDMIFTPKLFFESNVNYFQFLNPASLSQTDAKSVGFEINGAFNYRVFLNENFILQLGANLFIPGDAAKQLIGQDDLIFTGNMTLVTLF